jgi:hypothetical protein
MAAKYTADELYNIVKNNQTLRDMKYTDYTIATAVNSLIQTLKKHHGLENRGWKPNSTRQAGRDSYAYKREDLKKALMLYKETTNVHKGQGRFIIAETILSSFSFIEQFYDKKN